MNYFDDRWVATSHDHVMRAPNFPSDHGFEPALTESSSRWGAINKKINATIRRQEKRPYGRRTYQTGSFNYAEKISSSKNKST